MVASACLSLTCSSQFPLCLSHKQISCGGIKQTNLYVCVCMGLCGVVCAWEVRSQSSSGTGFSMSCHTPEMEDTKLRMCCHLFSCRKIYGDFLDSCLMWMGQAHDGGYQLWVGGPGYVIKQVDQAMESDSVSRASNGLCCHSLLYAPVLTYLSDG